MGRLLPDTGIRRRSFGKLDYYLWRLTWKWARRQPPEQADALGVRPVLRQVQQGQARPVGVRRPRTAAPTCTASPGPTSSDTRSSNTRASPDDPALGRLLGLATAAKRTLPINRRRTSGSTEPRTVAARSARPRSSPPQTGHKPHANGSTGWPPPARRSTSSGNTATLGQPAEPRLITPPLQPHPPATRACLSRMPETGTSGSEGGPASQGAGPIRRCARPHAGLVGGPDASPMKTPMRAQGLIQPVGPAP